MKKKERKKRKPLFQGIKFFLRQREKKTKNKQTNKKNYSVISHQSGWPPSTSLQTINAGEGVMKREPSHTFDGNVNWYSCYGEQYGDFLKTKNRASI